MFDVERFNPLDYSLALMKPERLTPRSAWVEHIPFAFALVQMCKPQTIVELGTSRGDSYCAFCLAVSIMKLPTRCTAIDTWQGDEHAGILTDNDFAELRKFHDARFADFSTLLQSTFDAARDTFSDGSIDILHIDGLHTYEAVKHDFESWLPKLSRGAVVLFHDTEARQKDFGVWKLWAELAPRYRSFGFRHGSGLGVLAVGPQAPEPILRFIRLAATQREDVLRYFEALGGGINALRFRRALATGYARIQHMLNERKQLLGESYQPTDDKTALQRPVFFMTAVLQQIRSLLTDDLKQRGIDVEVQEPAKPQTEGGE